MGHKSIYVHKELLAYSIEGRRVDMLTITSKSRCLNHNEDYINDPIMHPEKEERALLFSKPIVFLSARVHPGEVPSSHVLNGLLNFLLKE